MGAAHLVRAAALETDDPKAVEVALIRAHADAYANLSKFLGNEVTTRSTAETSAGGGSASQMTRATGREFSAALLRGVTFESARIEAERVTVRAVLSPGTVAGADQVRRAMAGAPR